MREGEREREREKERERAVKGTGLDKGKKWRQCILYLLV
jgi:hypothetical protein